MTEQEYATFLAILIHQHSALTPPYKTLNRTTIIKIVDNKSQRRKWRDILKESETIMKAPRPASIHHISFIKLQLPLQPMQVDWVQGYWPFVGGHAQFGLW